MPKKGKQPTRQKQKNETDAYRVAAALERISDPTMRHWLVQMIELIAARYPEPPKAMPDSGPTATVN
jgi:hypothetical protein